MRRRLMAVAGSVAVWVALAAPPASGSAMWCETGYACTYFCGDEEEICEQEGCVLDDADCVFWGMPICISQLAHTVICEYGPPVIGENE